MLAGRRILIVEDESLIAMELADIVETSGGRVAGPVRSNRDALRLTAEEAPDAALLDMNLADGDATPVTRRLMELGIPVVVCTAGLVPLGLRLAFPDLPVLRKPVDAQRLTTALATALDEGTAPERAEPQGGRSVLTPASA